MRQWSGRASKAGFFGLASFLLLGTGCGAKAAAEVPARIGGQSTESVASGLPPEGIELASATNAVPRADDEGSDLPKGPRLFAYDGYEKIYQKPDTDSPPIGLVRAGQAVPLVDGKPLSGPGIGRCSGGFYAVKPRGFICSGKHSTQDGNDARVRAAAEILPDTDAPMPYRVGVLIVGAPQYTRIPTPAEQKSSEPGLEEYQRKLSSGAIKIPAGSRTDDKKAGHGPSPAYLAYLEKAKPPLVASDDAYEGRKMAFVAELDAEGRTFLVTPDLTLVPKDKVRFVEASTLKGLELAKAGMRFPFGYTWIGDSPKLKKHDDGTYVETGEVYPRHTFVQLEGNVFRGKGGNYWKTADGTYIRHEQVNVFKKRERPTGIGARDKWIDVRVTWGTLIAYEGDEPVYATAVSPGQDGITNNPHGHNTKRGQYPVGWKMISADMSGVEKGKEWAVDEVPYVAYYKDSFAVHGAWWHDDFGRPKSHGCINAAPADAQWLWKWMDPPLPDGWYAVAAYRPDVKSTTVVVRP